MLVPDLVYRVVSVCRLLGYGFPVESLAAAERGGLDAIVADAGSSEAGPYHLGTGTSYFSRAAVKADYRRMAAAGHRLNIPVIVGNCGMAGGAKNVDWMLDIAREVFAELGIADAKVAVIRSDVSADTVLAELNAGRLRYEATNPVLDPLAIAESTIVAQMGVHPLIAALEAGARFVFAGRCCDIALFAADMIRRGVEPGIAFHAGHILESGAVACEPGSPADCLVGEIHADGSAVFEAPNPARRVTVQSLAAHGMHKRAHPLLHTYPEGVLCLEPTEYFAPSGRTAGIRGSRLAAQRSLSVRLEAARPVVAPQVSVIRLDACELEAVAADIPVYGRNGVEARELAVGEVELGVLATATAPTEAEARAVANHLTQELNRYGYPTRKTSGGNLAYPLAPKVVCLKDGELFRAVAPAGTRDPLFIKNYPAMKATVLAGVSRAFPTLSPMAAFQVVEADADHPIALVRDTAAPAQAQPGSWLDIGLGEAAEWSLAHILVNEQAIRNELFPITYYTAGGSEWRVEGTEHARYFDIADADYPGDIDEGTLCEIASAEMRGVLVGTLPLLDMAVVITSKNIGVDRLAVDLIFASAEAYESALMSNLFSREGLATDVGIAPERIVGSYFVDSCNAIKIVLARPAVSGSQADRDVFGAQQQAIFEGLVVPIYASSLSQNAFV